MATELLPLSPQTHRTHGWQRHDHYRFAAGDHLAPMLIAELSAALPYYPLAFASDPDGSYHLVALLGLHAGDNLYLNPVTGRWRTEYVPSFYRGYPFALRRQEGGDNDTYDVCFDHASDLYREEPDPAQGEERFFDDEGNPRPLMKKLMTFLHVTTHNRAQTDQAVAALAAAGLFEPWQLPLSNPDPARPLLQGLYRLNEAALNALDAQALKTLQDVGALQIVYAQLFSLPRLAILPKLYAARQSLADKTAPAPGSVTVPPSIDALFGEAPEIELKFDFDKL